MTQIILFHHAQGLTEGVKAFADRLRSAGHTVVTPDLFDGQVFATIQEGIAHADRLGFDNLIAAGVDAAANTEGEVVYAGFSLGVMPAQKLAQTRPNARGVLMYHSAVPIAEFGDSWPAGVDVQIHLNEDDPFDDRDVARELVEQASAVASAEMFVYPGSTHLFTDSSVDDYDAELAEQVMERTLQFLKQRA